MSDDFFFLIISVMVQHCSDVVLTAGDQIAWTEQVTLFRLKQAI